MGLLVVALGVSPVRASVTGAGADEAAIRAAYRTMEEATTQRNAGNVSLSRP